MPDLNIFNLDFGNLAKLLDKGRVDKVYNKMWHVAEKLASNETRNYIIELPAHVKEFKKDIDVLTSVVNFKKERIEYHMKKMEKLIEVSLKKQSEKK